MQSKQYRFGSKIRLIRERKNLTLKDVAQRARVSESLISQIERDKVSPSIDTLMAIADVLELDVEYLFRDYKRTPQAKIVRKGEQNRMVLDGVTYRQMAFHPETPGMPSLEVIGIEIPPEKEKGDQEYGHSGMEAGIILEGKGELIYGDEVSPLTEGDSITYSSVIPHIIRNTGGTPLKGIWILSPGRIFK